MKNTQFTLTYTAALIIGALLLIFSGEANIFNIMVIIIGALIALPSAYGIIRGFAGKKGTGEKREGSPILTAFESALGLILGVLMICIPSFFVHYLIYTLGILLILAGVLQIVSTLNASRDMGGINGLLYIMPCLTMIAGLVIVIVGPEKIASIATIITGIVLVLYAINGLITSGMHFTTMRTIAKENAREAVEKAKEAKEEAENEKARTEEALKEAEEKGIKEGEARAEKGTETSGE